MIASATMNAGVPGSSTVVLTMEVLPAIVVIFAAIQDSNANRPMDPSAVTLTTIKEVRANYA